MKRAHKRLALRADTVRELAVAELMITRGGDINSNHGTCPFTLCNGCP